MSYRYETQRKELFTQDGAEILLRVRDNVQVALEAAGAVMAARAISNVPGDVWTALAALDYLVERGELRELTGQEVAGQHRVFVRA